MRALLVVTLLLGGLAPLLGADAKRGHRARPVLDHTHEVSDFPDAERVAPTRRLSVESTAAPCGADGPRVQVVYYYWRGETNHIEAIRTDLIVYALAGADLFARSAAEDGGQRAVRFVTDGHCVPTVTVLDLPFNDLDPLFALAGRNRVILAFNGEPFGCGGAGLHADDQPRWDNDANLKGGVAIIGYRCWDRPATVAHELAHSFGAVQASAPNEYQGHCLDEYDIMCYEGPLRVECPDWSVDDHRFDCNNDDYFDAGPNPSGYLADHWNVAHSVYLDDSTRDTALDCGDCESRQGREQTVWLTGLAPHEPFVVLHRDSTQKASSAADADGTASVRLSFGTNFPTGPERFVMRGDRGSWAEATIRVRRD
jgi:hypothetical protein